MARPMRGSPGGTQASEKPKVRSDAYTGLLILSLLAQIAAAVFLYLDFSSYPDKLPEKARVSLSAPSAPAPGGPAPAPAPAPKDGAPKDAPPKDKAPPPVPPKK